MDFSTERLVAERLADRHLAALTALHRDAEVSRFLDPGPPRPDQAGGR